MIGTLMIFPPVLHALGRDQFGVWGAAISLVMVITIADFGIGPAIVTLVSHALASGNEDEPHGYLTAAIVTSCGISTCVLAGGALVALAIAPPQLLPVYLLAVTGVAVNVPLGSASSAWLALQRGWMVAFWDFVQTLLFIVGVGLAARLTKDIRIYVVAVYGALFIANALNMSCLLIRHPELRPRGWHSVMTHMRLVLTTASRYFVLSALDLLTYILDSVLALYLLGSAASAQMAIVQRVVVAALGLLMVVAQPLWPAFIDAAARGDRRWIFRALARGVTLVMVCAVAGSAVLVLFGVPLLKLWLKSDVGIDQSLLWAMAFWIVSLALVRVQMLLLNALRIMRFQILMFLVTTSIALALKFFLAPRYGVAGILTATAVTFPAIILPAVLWRIGRWRRDMQLSAPEALSDATAGQEDSYRVAEPAKPRLAGCGAAERAAPHVEILLSTYDGARHLGEFLRSLVGQDYRQWSLTVRDDGSSDDTLSVLRAWAGSQEIEINVLTEARVENLGVVRSFSRLLERSTARYAMFADQDDIWLPGKIRMTLEAMRRREEQVGAGKPVLVHTDLTVVDTELRVLSESLWRYQGLVPGRRPIFSHTMVENAVWGCTAMMNRPLIELVHEIPPQAIHHDWWIALVASAFGEIVSLDERTILWRRHGLNESDISGVAHAARGAITNLGGARRSLARALEDARQRVALFVDRYGDRLDQTQFEAARAFLGLPRQNVIGRRLAILRHGLFFGSHLRNAGLLALV